MAFDESLAARIRYLLARRKHVEEKRMFGGVGFLLNGAESSRLQKQGRDEPKAILMPGNKLSRNAPCPCGSDRVAVPSIANTSALGYNPP